MLLTIWSGLVLGSVYATVAFGFTISMLPSGIFNFAQGAIVTAGCYLTYDFLTVHMFSLVAILSLNIVVGVGLGILCEVICVRPLRGRAGRQVQRNELVTTVGFSTAVVGVIGLTWGYLPISVPFAGSARRLHFLSVIASPDEVVLLTGAVLAAIGLQSWFRRTRRGQACLAVAEDRDAASLRGVNVNLFSVAAFAAAGAFGTVTAIAVGPITYAVPTLANTIALGGFVAIAIGGHGNFVGSLGGGLLAGVVASVATRYIGGNYALLSVLALLVLALVSRPAGLGAAAAARNV